MKSQNAQLYKTDGTVEVVIPKGKKFRIEELWEMVHGGIEILDLGWKAQRYMRAEDRMGPTGWVSASLSGGLVRNGWVLVVNENGLNEELPVNEGASQLWGGQLVGDVLLCKRSMLGL